jgi:hypothetical protein
MSIRKLVRLVAALSEHVRTGRGFPTAGTPSTPTEQRPDRHLRLRCQARSASLPYRFGITRGSEPTQRAKLSLTRNPRPGGLDRFQNRPDCPGAITK